MGKHCGNCANGTWIKRKDAVPEVCLVCRYVLGEPSNWKGKTMTNADRIRAMSDEELADWLARTQIANVAEALEIARIPWEQPDSMKGEMKKECLEWLKQPAEVEYETL